MTLRCTVVHACPEYLRGDRLNYFRVPLGVNDRTIDNKSARQFRRSSPLLNFSFSARQFAGGCVAIATTAGKIGWFETATRVGEKPTNLAAREASKPFADPFCRHLVSENRNLLHTSVAKSKAKPRGIVSGLISASIVARFRRNSFYSVSR